MLRSVVVIRTSRVGLANHLDWSQLSLKALKTECKRKGLKVSGRKFELVKRLKDLDNTETIHQHLNENPWKDQLKNRQYMSPEKQVDSSEPNGKIMKEPGLKCDSRGTTTLSRENNVTTRNNESSIETSRVGTTPIKTAPDKTTLTKVEPIDKTGSECESRNTVSPPKKHNMTTTNNESSINTSQVSTTPIKISPDKAIFSKVEPVDITRIETEPTSTALPTGTSIGRVQKASSIRPASKMSAPFEECRGMFKTIKFSGNRDPKDQSLHSFSLRDKFFLLMAATCIATWWCWPLVPDFIFVGYKYLQSLF